jgi:transposase
MHKDSNKGPGVVAFLRHLLHPDRRRPLIPFGDMGEPHQSKIVNAFLWRRPRLETHFFPGDSPELIPDEWVWSHLKRAELAGYAPHGVHELRGGLRRAVMRIRVQPALIQSFDRAAELG